MTWNIVEIVKPDTFNRKIKAFSDKLIIKHHQILDVVGVCKSAADLQELTARNTGKLLKKREVTLVDNSGGAVSTKLWLILLTILNSR